jgi:ribosome-associated toxin RatA of RatAB toxin-antitoxin module
MAIDLPKVFADSDGRSPLVLVRMSPTGQALGASAVGRIERPVARVWEMVADVDRYPERVPMVHRLKRHGERVTVDLKFKVALFSAGFTFTADVVANQGERWFELRWVEGEPRAIRLRFELSPLDDDRACLVRVDGEFDAMSLGWLVKFFLKHHPEIQHGVFPGVVLVLLDAMRRAAEA